MHGVKEEVFTQTLLADRFRRVWANRKEKATVELYLIESMGHGTPVRRTKAPAVVGGAGPFMLDVSISSSLPLAKS